MDKQLEKRYFQILKRKAEIKKSIEDKYKRHISPLEEKLELLSKEEDEILLSEIKKVTEAKKINLVELTNKIYDKEKINE